MSVTNYLKCTLSNNSCPDWPECRHTSWIRIAGPINRTIMIMNHCQTHLWWPTSHSWYWSDNCYLLFFPPLFCFWVIFNIAFWIGQGMNPKSCDLEVFSTLLCASFSEPSDFWRQFVSRSYWSLCICWCSVGILQRPASHAKTVIERVPALIIWCVRDCECVIPELSLLCAWNDLIYTQSA